MPVDGWSPPAPPPDPHTDSATTGGEAAITGGLSIRQLLAGIPRWFIIALAVVAALFIVSLVAGVRSGNAPDPGALDASWPGSLLDAIPFDSTVETGDLSTSQPACLQGDQLVVPASSLCTYQIAESNRAARDLKLRMGGGLQLTVSVQQDDFNESEAIVAGQVTQDLDVLPGDPATLSLFCAGFGPCSAVLD